MKVKSLATRFIRSMEDDHLLEILAQLAQRCLNLKGKKRPLMRKVAVELERIRMSGENSATQQNYEVVEYNRTHDSEALDIVALTSIGTEFDSTTGTSSSFEPNHYYTTIHKQDNVA